MKSLDAVNFLFSGLLIKGYKFSTTSIIFVIGYLFLGKVHTFGRCRKGIVLGLDVDNGSIDIIGKTLLNNQRKRGNCI